MLSFFFFSSCNFIFYYTKPVDVKFVAVFGTGFIFSIFKKIYRTSVFTTFLVIQEFRIDLF